MKKILLTLILLILNASAKIHQKVIICGVCKDEAKRLPYSLNIIQKIGALFSDYRVVIYENNSKDKTPHILHQFAQQNPQATVISERLNLHDIIINRNKDGSIFRPEAIAYARNKVLEEIDSPKYNGFEYVIWMDLDFVLEPDYQGIIETFRSNQEWDAVFAYGIDPAQTYWDWYALRDQECPLGSELLGNHWWYMPKKKDLLSKNADWYPVYSAFGGCGIYKKEALKGCRYSALVTHDLAAFNEILIKNNPAHPIINQYLDTVKKIKNFKIIEKTKRLNDITDPTIGIKTIDIHSSIVWRMSSFVYRYPSVCEHVCLHASMFLNGYDKLFINPRLIFRYGG